MNARLLGLLALLPLLFLGVLGFGSADTEKVTTVSRLYFEAFFAGRDDSGAYLLSADPAMYKSEMETRRAKLSEMEATSFDFSAIKYAVPLATDTRAMVQSNGTVAVATKHGVLKKEILRVFELVNLGGTWKIKSNWYGVYDRTRDSQKQAEEFDMIDTSIANERDAKYERMFADVKKGKNATQLQPKKKQAP